MSRLLPHRPPLLAAHRLPPTAPSASVLCRYSPTLKPSPIPSILSLIPGAGAFLRRRADSVRCMANPRRVKMVSKQIRRELSDMLLTDTVLQYAVVPEAALGADRYLSSIATISDVEVSGDLQVVKVYVSVFGDERGRDVAIAGLKAKTKYVRSELGKRMRLRLTPEIRFIEDDSVERGSRVIAILDRIKNEKRMAESQSKEENVSADQAQDESDWEVDDPNEGIIYVK